MSAVVDWQTWTMVAVYLVSFGALAAFWWYRTERIIKRIDRILDRLTEIDRSLDSLTTRRPA